MTKQESEIRIPDTSQLGGLSLDSLEAQTFEDQLDTRERISRLLRPYINHLFEGPQREAEWLLVDAHTCKVIESGAVLRGLSRIEVREMASKHNPPSQLPVLFSRPRRDGMS